MPSYDFFIYVETTGPSLMQSLILCFCRRVVPVILEDGSENLSALDAALQDRTAQDWVSPALTESPTFHLLLPSEPYVISTYLYQHCNGTTV
jgi:hypothetical protein